MPSCSAPSARPRMVNRCCRRPSPRGCLPQVRRPPARDSLSERELEVLTLVSCRRNNRDAAPPLMISEATVKTHLLHIYAKLSVSDRAAAVAEAFNRGLLTPEKR